ncbi:MAG: YkvA family protein, partial [Chloroflexota bacterium]
MGRLPRYLRLGKALYSEPAIARQHKLALAAGIGYAVLPFDLLPGIIPVLGQLDDLGALLLGLRFTLRHCPADVADGHLAAAGVTREMLDADLRTVGVTTLWIGQTTVQNGKKLISGAARFVQS